eukprot:503973-Karenia_brevis.AAC.1
MSPLNPDAEEFKPGQMHVDVAWDEFVFNPLEDQGVHQPLKINSNLASSLLCGDHHPQNRRESREPQVA